MTEEMMNLRTLIEKNPDADLLREICKLRNYRSAVKIPCLRNA